MKLNKQYFFVLLSLIATFGAACTSSTPTNTNANQAVVTNTNNTVPTPAANTSVTTGASPPIVAMTGSPSATVAAHHQAMIKKDEMAFRKTLSKATLQEFSKGATEEETKSLLEYYTGFSAPPKQPYETRNERISGDVALLEIKDSDTGKWSWTQLVREEGEWKLDLTTATSEKMLKPQSGK